MSILSSLIILVSLGILLGSGLSFASSKLSVKKDDKLVEMEELMPGANCGSCGYAGCSAYAEAVYKGTAEIGLCNPGGQALATKMSEIMGVQCKEVERKVAFVFCNACSEDVKSDFSYDGLSDCNAASILLGGSVSCKYGCLHLGSCMKVCDQNAIEISSDKKISVNREKCIGCGKCVKICPKNVIKLIPYSLKYVVACNSKDPGQKVRKSCEKGCIGCKICETKFPESGIKVENNLASVNTEVDNDNNSAIMEQAIQSCPRKIILKI